MDTMNTPATAIPREEKRRRFGTTSGSFDRAWLEAAGRFLPDRFYLAGLSSVPVDIPDWTKPNEGRLRIFESDALERLTVVHPATPAALFGPMILGLLWWGARTGLGAAVMTGLFAGGLLFWTLAEYAMHRMMFHFTPRSRWQVVLAYFMHGIHHAYPDDDRRLVMPPVLSLVLAVPFYFGFRAALGTHFMPALAGFFLGYLCYDYTHYAVHALPMKSKLGNMIRKHHMLHHFATPDRRFGVSTPLWDYVFGTIQ